MCTWQVGKLWTSLADYYIRQGMMEKARDVYEEGLNTVTTVRDFSLVFDTLTHFEESLISYKMQQHADEPEGGNSTSDGEDFLLKDSLSDLDLRCDAKRNISCLPGLATSAQFMDCCTLAWIAATRVYFLFVQVGQIGLSHQEEARATQQRHAQAESSQCT